MGCWAAWLTLTPVADASTEFVRAIGWKKKLLMRRKTQAIQGIVQPRYRHWLLLRSLVYRNWGDWCLKRNCESNWVENISRWCAESLRLFKKSYSQDAAGMGCWAAWLTLTPDWWHDFLQSAFGGADNVFWCLLSISYFQIAWWDSGCVLRSALAISSSVSVFFKTRPWLSLCCSACCLSFSFFGETWLPILFWLDGWFQKALKGKKLNQWIVPSGSRALSPRQSGLWLVSALGGVQPSLQALSMIASWSRAFCLDGQMGHAGKRSKPNWSAQVKWKNERWLPLEKNDDHPTKLGKNSMAHSLCPGLCVNACEITNNVS